MKRCFFLFLHLFLSPFLLRAQQTIPDSLTIDPDELERLVEQEINVDEDLLPASESAAFFVRHKLPLNRASEADLQALGILPDTAIAQFLRYRALFGKLLSLYELQAIPGWTPELIRSLLPYVKLDGEWSFAESWPERLQKGSHFLLLRYGRSLRARRYIDTGSRYAGNNDRVLFRYSYQYKNLLAWGISGEKDAGEAFLRNRGKGFDHYGFYAVVRGMGKLQELLLGDYTVNLGQGLVQWQNLAFGKGGELSGVKRQGPTLKPYRSNGEYNFFRGAAATIRHKRQQWVFFASYRKLDAVLHNDSSGGTWFSTIQTGGLHRTEQELRSRAAVSLLSGGIQWKYRFRRGHIAFNHVQYAFSDSLKKTPEPYNVRLPQDRLFRFYSIDYSYTWRNLHFFGEGAMSGSGGKAFTGGLLLSLHKRMQGAVLIRSISSNYMSLFGNAFAESSTQSNEQGIYSGISVELSRKLKLDLFTDVFRFPWLRYRVDIPGYGYDYQGVITYTPSRNWSLALRYRYRMKTGNRSDTDEPFHIPELIGKQQFRIHFQAQPEKTWGVRMRMEWVRAGKGEEGFLGFGDWSWHPENSGIGLIMRVLYYETGGYASRIFVYENDVQYSFSTGSFYGQGIRWALNLSWNPGEIRGLAGKQRVRFWLKIAQSVEKSGGWYGGRYVQRNDPQPPDAKLQIQIEF